jgi:hypothetical protein
MQEDLPRDDAGADDDELLYPAYWLVHGLEWPGGSVAEAAIAVAPGMIPRDQVSPDAFQVLAAPTCMPAGTAPASCSFPS